MKPRAGETVVYIHSNDSHVLNRHSTKGLPDDVVQLIDMFAAPEEPPYAAFAEKYGTRSNARCVGRAASAKDGLYRFQWAGGLFANISTCILSPCIICCRRRQECHLCHQYDSAKGETQRREYANNAWDSSCAQDGKHFENSEERP